MQAFLPDARAVHLQAFRLVLRSRPEGDMIRALSIPVVIFTGAALAVAAASCVLAVRALRRTAAREAALNADLVRQKEALRQAEALGELRRRLDLQRARGGGRRRQEAGGRGRRAGEERL